MGDPKARTIWVGGLPKDIEEPELLKSFSKCGRVVETKIRHSQIDTFAFVEFADDRGYDKALSTMDQSPAFGSPIKVNTVISKTSGNDVRDERDDSRDRRPAGKGQGRPRSESLNCRDNSREANYAPRARRARVDPYQDEGPPPRARDDSAELVRKGGKGRGQRDNAGGRGHRDVRDYDDRGQDEYDGRGRGRDEYDDRDRKGGGRNFEGENSRGRGRGGRYQDDRGYSPEFDRGGGGRRGMRQRSPSVDEGDQLSSSRLWVGGMPKDVTELEIQRCFSKHGVVQEIVIRHSEADTFGFVQYKRPEHALAAIGALNQTERFGQLIKVAPAGGKGDKKGDKGKGSKGKGGNKGYNSRDSRSPRRMRSRSPRGKGKSRGKSPRRQYSRSPARRGQQARPAPREIGVRYCVTLGNLPLDMERDELQEMGATYGKILKHETWPDPKNGCVAGVIEYGTRDEAIKALNDLNDRRMDDWEKKITAGLQQRDG